MRRLKRGSNTNHVQNLELGAIDVNHFKQINAQGVTEPVVPRQLGLVCWLFLAGVFTRLAAMQATGFPKVHKYLSCTETVDQNLARNMTKLMAQMSRANADSLRKSSRGSPGVPTSSNKVSSSISSGTGLRVPTSCSPSTSWLEGAPHVLLARKRGMRSTANLSLSYHEANLSSANSCLKTVHGPLSCLGSNLQSSFGLVHHCVCKTQMVSHEWDLRHHMLLPSCGIAWIDLQETSPAI